MEKRQSLPSALVHDCNVSSQESEVRKLLVQEPVGATFKLFGCYKAKKKKEWREDEKQEGERERRKRKERRGDKRKRRRTPYLNRVLAHCPLASNTVNA